jgi:hypothetical protein
MKACAAVRVDLAKSSIFPAAGVSSSSGVFLMRMVVSGVITPCWL